MTGKLIHYEFRSILKIMGIVWLALPAISVLFSVSMRLQSADTPDLLKHSFALETLFVSSSILFTALFFALGAVTVAVVLMRFYKGLLRDEGYLMHTLPVKCWQLITAKGVVALCVCVGSVLVAMLSFVLISCITDLAGTREFFAGLGETLRSMSAGSWLLWLEILLLLLVLCVSAIYRAYAAMAIGQTAHRHRILLSIGVYLGIGVILTTLTVLIFRLLDMPWMSGILDSIGMWVDQQTWTTGACLAVGVAIVPQIIAVGVFHVITEQVLRRKLNLE